MLEHFDPVCSQTYQTIFYFYIGNELPDECSLRKCGVQNGDRLKLVLAMRGGPINTRRVALPQKYSK